ncbi:MAG: (2Fe-2S)-binding protein [candidate division Zixibacteria bacterium]|nr:(2Fe-2S)-binding protein [candidate division Zixibacteria bacterium]
MKLKFKLNNKDTEIDVHGGMRLLDLLREELNLTGVKEGCGKGECGACTIIIDRKPVNSCLVLAAQINGKEVITIEGLLEDSKLNPIQQAFVDEAAIQCGFCSPGLIMSAQVLLDNNPNPSNEEIARALSGNLCRCTGYTKVIEAVKSVSANQRNKND